MKSKRLLIGLIVAAFVGGAHFAGAQPKANFQNNLIEIGPDNIAGRVRAIIVDEGDPTHNTLYAGGVAGGLYKKTGDTCWQFIPCYINDRQMTLPISCMVQLPNNNLLIGTGEGLVSDHGFLNSRMSPRGSGLFVYNVVTGSFRQLQSTDPSLNTEWSYINCLAYMQPDGDTNMYVYAATNEGLYRWKLSAMNPSWSTLPTLVESGKFMDIVMVPLDNMAYATAEGKVYRIGNVTSQSAAVEITSSNAAFATASRIELAAKTVFEWDETSNSNRYNTYLYAVVADATGLLEGVYLSKNQQAWVKLTTATMMPFTSNNPGTLNSAIAINPNNVKQILVGGATLWDGTGYVANSNYQWIKDSYSEDELNSGNYMGSVYSTPLFLHSGIHQIVPTWQIVNGDTVWTTFYATDGGVYQDYGYNMWDGEASLKYFRSLNKGLNTVQFNHIAVTPDGSIVGGAIDNSCPFIQSRNAHEGSVADPTWYDDDAGSILNHMGSVTWTGNGGDVAASRFQQLMPMTRRNLFLSCEPGHFYYDGRDGVTPAASYGRACADYSDYNNTQTWTTGDGFIANTITTTNAIPKMDLWETTNNTIWNDSITFTIDTNLTYFHNGVETPLSGSTVIVAGDQIWVASKPNFDYPFRYTFNSSFTVKDKLTHKVPNKVVSRMIVTGRHSVTGAGQVFMTLTPNYYRNVWSYAESNSATANLMLWGTLFQSDPGYSVGDVAFSRDGRNVYIAVSNDSTGKSFLFRIWDYNKINANNASEITSATFRFQKDNPDYPENPRITHYDTIFAADGNWFNRPITSIAVDPRDGKDNLILTFGKYNNGDANMVYIENAGDPDTRVVSNFSVVNTANGMSETDPVYSAIVECTTGAIFAGTEKGVYRASSASSSVWSEFGDFNGVPVTSIVQQTSALPRVTYMAREGVNDVKYLFAKTKYPYAIYFGTYGRGVFMDTTYVTDHVAEVSDPEDWNVGITTVTKGDNQVAVYPNPAIDNATLELTVVDAGKAVMKIYDVNGKLVHSEQMGQLGEGVHRYSIDCSKFGHGMYLMNVVIGNYTATTKLIVR